MKAVWESRDVSEISYYLARTRGKRSKWDDLSGFWISSKCGFKYKTERKFNSNTSYNSIWHLRQLKKVAHFLNIGAFLHNFKRILVSVKFRENCDHFFLTTISGAHLIKRKVSKQDENGRSCSRHLKII